MKMRLNGWQRLWVVLAVVWCIVVGAGAYIGWPTKATTPHRDEFLDRMDASLRRQVVKVYPNAAAAPAGRFLDHDVRLTESNGAVLMLLPHTDPALVKLLTAPSFQTLPAQTKHEILMRDPDYAKATLVTQREIVAYLAKRGLTLENFEYDAVKVALAYDTVLKQAVHTARWRVVRVSLGAWLFPCVVLYALGWSVAWIRRGFRAKIAS